MRPEGGCYCRAVRYVAEGKSLMKARCHCRECQYLTGGSPNVFVAMPTDQFTYTTGKPRQFKCSDIENAVTRKFCPNCGMHLAARPQSFNAVIVKVGTLDDPTLYGMPDMAIFTIDKQPPDTSQHTRV